MDRNILISCKEKLNDVVFKMEEYIVNNEDCEPVSLSIMYISVRDALDIIREELNNAIK